MKLSFDRPLQLQTSGSSRLLFEFSETFSNGGCYTMTRRDAKVNPIGWLVGGGIVIGWSRWVWV